MTIPTPLTGEIPSVAKEFGLASAVLEALVRGYSAEAERCGRTGEGAVRALAAGFVAAIGAEPVEKPDLAELPGDFLKRVGMDGHLWAGEFRKMAVHLGYSDMDEGWLIGWFCNAIMAGWDEAKLRAERALSPPTDRSGE